MCALYVGIYGTSDCFATTARKRKKRSDEEEANDRAVPATGQFAYGNLENELEADAAANTCHDNTAATSEQTPSEEAPPSYPAHIACVSSGYESSGPLSQNYGQQTERIV